jgi:copper chaperone CopZ
MVKCPYCENEVARRVEQVDVEKMVGIRVKIVFSEYLTCKVHGVFIRQGQTKEVEL